jgi:hypothetical protein
MGKEISFRPNIYPGTLTQKRSVHAENTEGKKRPHFSRARNDRSEEPLANCSIGE